MLLFLKRTGKKNKEYTRKWFKELVLEKLYRTRHSDFTETDAYLNLNAEISDMEEEKSMRISSYQNDENWKYKLF